MSKYELKTTTTTASVTAFVDAIEDEEKRKGVKSIVKLMKQITGKSPKMWGGSIIGFDSYSYKYDSGQSGEWLITGLSPRKQNITVYIMPGFEKYDTLMSQLGKYKTGKSCLYIKKLEDINLEVLAELISASVDYMRKKYPAT